MSGSLADTDHVLGHELVHAFQFDLTGDDPRERDGAAPGILAIPLWFVEGMAEYLSLGPGRRADGDVAARRGAAREAAAHPRPRRPEVLSRTAGATRSGRTSARSTATAPSRRSMRSAANPRFDLAGLARQLGTDPDTLTADWHAAIQRNRRSAVADELLAGHERSRALVIDRRRGGGRFNVGPRVSPDGTADRVLLRARSLLGRAVSRRRRDRPHQAQAARSRRPTRISTASSS